MSLLDVHVQLLVKHNIQLLLSNQAIHSKNLTDYSHSGTNNRRPSGTRDQGGKIRDRPGNSEAYASRKERLANSDIPAKLIAAWSDCQLCHLFVRWELVKRDMSCATKRLHTVSPHFSPFVQLVYV